MTNLTQMHLIVPVESLLLSIPIVDIMMFGHIMNNTKHIKETRYGVGIDVSFSFLVALLIGAASCTCELTPSNQFIQNGGY